MEIGTLSRINSLRSIGSIACAFFPCIVLSQSFRTAGECEQVLKQIEAQATHWDSAFMDCAAGAADHKVHDCRSIASDSPRYRAAFTADAAKRDQYIAQAKSIRPLCEQLRTAERQRERQDALERSRQQQAQQQAQDQDRRRTQLSLEQYNNARVAEARTLGDNNRRYEELKRQQQMQQLAAQRVEQDRQAAENHARVDQSMSALRKLAGIPDPATTSTVDQYRFLQEKMQKLHEQVQKGQPGVVNEIQNQAWSNIEERHTQTMTQVEDLKRSIDAFSSESPTTSSTPSPSPASSRLPTASSYQASAATPSKAPSRGVDAELEQIASGAYVMPTPATDTVSQPLVMAAATSAVSGTNLGEPSCSSSVVMPQKPAEPSADLSQSDRCAVTRRMSEERKLALSEANRCGRTGDATAIQRQLRSLDRQLRQECR